MKPVEGWQENLATLSHQHAQPGPIRLEDFPILEGILSLLGNEFADDARRLYAPRNGSRNWKSGINWAIKDSLKQLGPLKQAIQEFTKNGRSLCLSRFQLQQCVRFAIRGSLQVKNTARRQAKHFTIRLGCLDLTGHQCALRPRQMHVRRGENPWSSN